MKLQHLQKVEIWAFGLLVQQINSLWEILKLKRNFQKIKVLTTGKSPFFLIGPFCSVHFICLNIGFWYDRFEWKCSFLKKVFLFRKICFKVKVLNTFKIFRDCHIKTCRSLKRRAFLKILVPIFKRNYALSVGFKMKPLRKSVFQWSGKN